MTSGSSTISYVSVIENANHLTKSYLIVLVVLIHTAIAFIFRNNLTSVLNDYLMRVEAAIATNSIPTIRSLDHFDTNSVLATSPAAFLEISKCTICAVSTTSAAISIITLVEHDSVLAINVTSTVWSANTF